MDAPEADAVLARAIYRYGSQLVKKTDEVVLLCVGTDRSIGDSLGPLVGSILAERGSSPFTILGTLDNPVHASNLCETVDWIGSKFKRPLVVAVDACLGRVESVGVLTTGKGSLRPGAGVNKTLPAVGDLFITGVVNVGGFMEYFVLQNTRLSLVMRMARIAAMGIGQGLTALAAARTTGESEVSAGDG
jgi:putative sporulation protein YyaC